MEHFGAWYTGDADESLADVPAFHPARVAFWMMLFCNVVVPQVFWSRRVRRSTVGAARRLAARAARHVARALRDHRAGPPARLPAVVVGQLHARPSVDLGILAGTLGFFGLLFLAFLRFMPFIPVSEMKEEAVLE